MRRQSSCLVSATNKNSAFGVLFDVDYDVIVKKPCFQQGSTLKFLKNFRTFFCERIHSVESSIPYVGMLTNSKYQIFVWMMFMTLLGCKLSV